MYMIHRIPKSTNTRHLVYLSSDFFPPSSSSWGDFFSLSLCPTIAIAKMAGRKWVTEVDCGLLVFLGWCVVVRGGVRTCTRLLR